MNCANKSIFHSDKRKASFLNLLQSLAYVNKKPHLSVQGRKEKIIQSRLLIDKFVNSQLTTNQ